MNELLKKAAITKGIKILPIKPIVITILSILLIFISAIATLFIADATIDDSELGSH